jgi:hypothetical protein
VKSFLENPDPDAFTGTFKDDISEKKSSVVVDEISGRSYDHCSEMLPLAPSYVKRSETERPNPDETEQKTQECELHDVNSQEENPTRPEADDGNIANPAPLMETTAEPVPKMFPLTNEERDARSKEKEDDWLEIP